ncbi:MAG: GAF domain-containing protein [Anaerolineaceae bacterium]|nr:GAF domain-containing protein [Anaerolineaceae bacterium]MCB9099231.1 GAF domain-containing protein [Anaerolineales bacterium]
MEKLSLNALLKNPNTHSNSDAQLKFVLQSMPVAIIIANQDGLITFANKKCEALFGYNQDELIDEPVELLVPDRLRGRHAHHRTDYTRDPYVRMMGSGMDLVGRHKDGSEIPIEVGLSFTEFDDRQQIIASITNISIQKQTKDTLEQHVQTRTKQLSTLLRMSQNVASTLDLETLVNLTLDQLQTVVPFNEGAVFIQENGDLRLLSYRGPRSHQDVLNLRLPIDKLKTNGDIFNLKKPVIIKDTQTNKTLASVISQISTIAESNLLENIRSWAWIPLVAKKQTIGALALCHNQPNYFSQEQVQLAFAFANQVVVAIENAQLYSRVKQHSGQLESMFLVHQAITSRLDAEAILQLIADSARRLTSTRLSVVYLVDGTELRVAAFSSESNTSLYVGQRVPFARSAIGQVIQTGRPLLIRDIKNSTFVDIEPIRRLGICCYLVVPMLSIFESIGIIAVGDKQLGVLGPQDEETLMMLASGAVIGLENARLYYRERERRLEADQRRRVAESLRDMLTVLNSDRTVDEILEYIALQASQVLDARGSVVFRLQDEAFAIQASYGLSANNALKTNEAMNQQIIRHTLLTRQPVVLSNLNDPTSDSEDLLSNEKMQLLLVNGFRAVLAVPLIVKEEVYGSLALYYNEPRDFSTDEIDLAITFCDQAALAIENARLQIQAEEAAVAAERHRLARDLHDAVTQSLFSASLIADIMPRLWDRDQDEARRRLAELRQLTRGAMAEMRTLLLELRPAALTEGRLSEVLRHLTEAINSRTQTAITLKVDGEYGLPPDVQVGLYRITQEALNNIVKHSRAESAIVSLTFEPEQLKLCIEDNGRGFETSGISSEHLGVGIMRERADNIGASFKIHSQLGSGTRINVAWPALP